MGEALRQVGMADLLNRVRDQFTKLQRGQISIDSNPEVSVTVPERATIQSIAALLQNALDASAENRPVLLSAKQCGSVVRISITDQGCGMPETVLRRVGEPFYSTKEPGKGMGLGTFLVRTFAERLGGSVSFDSVAGHGTTVTLELPADTARQNGHVPV
jgi:two-component system sensor histidine kinase RegB